MVYENVVKYCERNGLSVAAFEKLCGLPNATVRKWENDKSKPMLTTLEKIAKATGIPVQKWIE